MVGRLVTLIAGVAFGVLLMLVLGRLATSSDGPIAASSMPSRTSEWRGPGVATETAAKEAADRQPVHAKSVAPADESAASNDPVRIPSVYREIIGPVRPRHLYFSELHALFEKEPIDPAWANAMETGINDHVAIYGAGEGVVIEYVECRSRYCEVGGFSIEGHESNFSSVWADMRRSDWWQGGDNYQGTGGEHRPFLAIMPRYDRQPRQ